MANDCLPQVQACAMRVCRLDGAGVPQPGASNMYVSDALVTMEVTKVYTDGTEIEEKNACDVVAVRWKSPPTFKRIDVKITIITPDPELSEMLSNGSVLTDGAAKGYAAPDLGVVATDAISVEVWARRINDGRIDSTFPYAWWVYPWLQNLRPDNHTHDNANLPMTFLGEGYENDNWFDGPLNDWPVSSNQVYQWIPTASIPAAQCGYQTIAAS